MQGESLAGSLSGYPASDPPPPITASRQPRVFASEVSSVFKGPLSSRIERLASSLQSCLLLAGSNAFGLTLGLCQRLPSPPPLPVALRSITL